ncbi:hypothetical protein [Pseudactinotalea sp. HY160]|nr:hypothetical protein [Pseudactinotalea sp. HY160]
MAIITIAALVAILLWALDMRRNAIAQRKLLEQILFAQLDSNESQAQRTE